MRGLLAALGLVLLAPAGAGAEATRPEFERDVLPSAPGLAAVRLDRHVYDTARADLGDLRVEDAAGTPVPYVLDRGPGPAGPERRPRMRNRGHTPDRRATVVLDFGERILKDRLVLRLTGRNFRRRVMVEGSDAGATWTTLVDDAWLFAIPEPNAVRSETVVLPENDFPLLRVTVEPGARERMRVEILEAWVPAREPGGRREETLSPGWSRSPEAPTGETWLDLDLGARRQPFEAVVLEVEDDRFFREVRAEVRRDPSPLPARRRAEPARWDPLAKGVVYRFEAGGSQRERLRVDAQGRGRGLRVRVQNGDDRPLVVEAVRVQVPVERILFEAEAGAEYRLTYGAPDLETPEYDLGRTLGPEPEAAPAELGAPVRRAMEADVLPWTERHPVLLWAGLLLIVAALGAVTWKALRSV